SGSAIKFDNVRIENGTVIYRSATGTDQRFEKLTATLTAPSLYGPYQANGNLTYQGIPATLEASLGNIEFDRPAVVSLRLGLAERGNLAFSGSFQRGPSVNLSGRIEAESGNLSTLVNTVIGGKVPLPALEQKLVVHGTLNATPATLALDDMLVTFGAARATGAVNAGLEGGPRVDVVLEVGRIDLDKIMGDIIAQAAAAPPVRNQPAAPGTGQAGAGRTAMLLPDDIALSLDLTVGAIDYRGRLIRQLRTNMVLDDGRLALNQLSAQLPGGTEASLLGGAANGDHGVRFQGSVEMVSTNLREFAEWLRVDLVNVPADRMRSLSLQSDVSLDSRELLLSQLDLRVDSSKITGGLVYRLSTRPSFGVTLTLDRLNLDAYMAAVQQRLAPVLPEPTPRADGASPQPPLAVLDSFDANMKLQVGQVTYRGQQIRDITIDASVQDGVATIRDVSVSDLAGGRAKLSGSLVAREDAPAGELLFDLSTRDPGRLFQLLNFQAPVEPARLGRLALKGKLSGTPASFEVDTALNIAGAAMTVTGSMGVAQFPPRLDLAAEGSHPDLAQLLSAFLGRNPKDGPPLGDVRLWLTAKSGDTDALAFNGRVEAAGGMATLEGDVNPFAPVPTFALNFEANSGNAVRLARVLAPNYRPVGDRDRPFVLTTRLSGNASAFDLADIVFKAGDIEMTGGGGVSRSGERPRVTAKLISNDIVIDPWLPDPALGAGPASPRAPIPVPMAGPQGWSREPLSLGGLRSIDLDLNIEAASIRHGNYVVDSATLAVLLQDGVLDLSTLEGGLFGGTFLAQGQIVVADLPTMRLTVRVKDADLRLAAASAGQPQQIRGLLDLELDAGSRGNTEATLISAMNGGGRFKVREGVAEGFDLQQVSDQLKELDSVAAFLGLAKAAFSGGETPFQQLEGTYKIGEGIVSTDDTTLVASAGTGKPTGTADLPKQQLDATAVFQLTEHPNAPPLTIEFTGPLAKPRTEFRTRDLEAFIAQRAVERGLMRLLPEGTTTT
ncbi:MAG: AsmA family protein, partial [Alphaproteobacteria bacterium]|nr:AsmA family protein [Alphaproteobacteria bacterium]